MSNTPEWFRLTADDQKPLTTARKPFPKSIKLSLIAAPLVMIGLFGAVAVGSNKDFDDEAPAISKSNAVVSTVASTVASTESAKVNIASNQSDGNSNSPALETSGTPGIGIGVPAPSADSEHEEGDDDGFFGHHDDDEHEGREHHHEGHEH